MSEGYLYILFNPSFRPNRYKLGMTTRSPSERASELSRSTGVPEPYEVAYEVRVQDCRLAEQLIEDRLAQHRIRSNREFYEIPLHEIVALANEVAEKVGIVPLNDSGMTKAKDNRDRGKGSPASSVFPQKEVDFSAPAGLQGTPGSGARNKRGRKTIEEHLKVCDEERRSLFEKLSVRIKEIDPGIQENSWSYGVAYRLNNNFVEMYFRRKRLEICLRPRHYHDPKKLLRKVPDNYEWTLNRRFMFEHANQLDYLVSLVRQSYEDVR